MSGQDGNITRVLQRWQDGDPAALDELTPLVMKDLRILALHYLGPDYHRNHSLQTTELIDEFYAAIAGDARKPAQPWANRKQFFGFAGTAMRNLLLDHIRHRLAIKRGGTAIRVPLEDIPGLSHDPQEVLQIGEAVEKLEAVDPLQGQIVTLLFFAGLTRDEAATALEIPLSRLKREWRLAKLWLRRALAEP